jgi:hypothetical protein
MSGMTLEVDQNEDDEIRHHFAMDVEPVLNYTTALRNDNATDVGIKKDLWLYAVLPPVIILKLKYEYGIDVFKRDDQKKMMQVINRDFPHLKTTSKTHTVKH